MNKLIFISYSLFLLLFTIFSYAFIDPNLIYLKKIYTGFAFDNTFITTAFYVFFIFSFFIFYFLFLFLLKKSKISLKNIKFLIAITVGTLLLSYPAMLSYDIFNYIATAKTLFFYHENPYIVMPIEFINDPLLLFMHAANKVALYGISWITLTSIPHFFGFGNFILTLFTFKLFVLIFYIAVILLIWKISRNLFSVVLFALNPLVIIETLVSGHNDIVMMFLVLFSFFLIMQKKVIPATAVFIFSIFIKYATLFLIPVFLYIVWKTLIKEKINWSKIYLVSFLLMLLAFLMAPVREEIYQWYAIWFLSFASLIPERKFILQASLVFAFGLMLRYTPFMYSGTYLGLTPDIKIIASFAPPVLFSIYYGVKNKI